MIFYGKKKKKKKEGKNDASNARGQSRGENNLSRHFWWEEAEEKGEKRWIKDEARAVRLEDEQEMEKEAVWVGEWLQERPRYLLPSLTFPCPTIPSSPSRSPRLSSLLSAFNYFASRRGEQRVRLAIHSTSCFVSTLDEGSLVKTFFLNVRVSSSLFLPSFFFQKKKKISCKHFSINYFILYFFWNLWMDLFKNKKNEIIIFLLFFVSKGEENRCFYRNFREFCCTGHRGGSRCSKLIRFRNNKFVLQRMEAD